MGADFNDITYKLKEKVFKNKQKKEETKYKNKIKIKSIFIKKKVLSHLSEIKKLDIIKYNNKLRNDFGYTIDDYKKLCKRYILGTRNGKGKGKEYIMNSSI